MTSDYPYLNGRRIEGMAFPIQKWQVDILYKRENIKLNEYYVIHEWDDLKLQQQRYKIWSQYQTQS